MRTEMTDRIAALRANGYRYTQIAYMGGVTYPTLHSERTPKPETVERFLQGTQSALSVVVGKPLGVRDV